MPEFKSFGLDELMLSLEEIAAIPEEVQDEILNEQAEIILKAQQESILAHGIYDRDNKGRHVVDSLKKSRPKRRKKDGVRVVNITPSGSRRRGNTVTRNAEILFVNEYGRKEQKARPAIREANEKSADKSTQAALEIYDRWLRSKEL